MDYIEDNGNTVQKKEYPESEELLVNPGNREYQDEDFLKAIGFLATLHKIFGVIAMIEGAILSLTIVGALIGVPFILAGKKLFNSGGDLANFNMSNSMGDIRSFFSNYKKYWKNIVIVIAVQIIGGFIAFIILISTIFMAGNRVKTAISNSAENLGNTQGDIRVYPDYAQQTENGNADSGKQSDAELPFSIRRDLDLNELHNLMDEVVANGNENELSKYTKEELKVLRNMIFAEKGYIFEGGELEKYFKKKPWYKPYIKDQSTIELNEYEKAFVTLLRKYEGIPEPKANTSQNGTANRARFRSSRNAYEIDLDELHELMDEVVAHGNEKALTEYSKKELKIIRNMIFAEKGYVFKGGDMEEYFNTKPWYDPYIEDQSTIELDEYEKAFVSKLRKYEK